MQKLRDDEQREAVSMRSGGAESPQDLPTTANTAAVIVPDQVLQKAKITLGMLADWGGSRYIGDSARYSEQDRASILRQAVHPPQGGVLFPNRTPGGNAAKSP